MADTRTPAQRRYIMQSVGTRNTAPEMVVRKLLHGLGYRYRLHSRSLPGRPDVVFPGRRKAVLVHGCFWHGHGCAKGRLPKSRLEYWGPKIEKNRTRDAAVVAEIEDRGWRVLVVWQCEIKDLQALKRRLVRFLDR
ncbi:MAG TPA: very short patch repair endonuclease [Xanthobacteraceae bacterium]|nr:very short patch repair endonuclease [Xanthobacteraceae bacterium]